jgi:hypothetical protein
MMWMLFAAPNTLAAQASGGMQMFCGSSGANFQQWYVRGADTYTYGGWVCVPVDPAVSEDTHTGTPSGTKQWFGAGVKLGGIAAVSKGNPWGVDVVRYGRCEARVAYGSTADGYATINGFAAVNDTEANRWGLLQAVQGGYLMQGLVVLGYVNACDFRDANKSVFIANTEKVISSFNAIEVRQSGSRVDMTAISFTALGTTARGNWITTDNATINITGCTFTDMGTFGFLAASTILNTTFRRTDKITTGGATITGCTIDSSRATTALLAATPADAALVSNTAFTSDGTGYGIEVTGTAANFGLTGVTFDGYEAYQAGGTTTGNEAIFINIASGELTISITGGDTPSYRTAGCTVTISSSVTVTLTGLKNPSEVRVFNAGTTTERSGTGAESVTDGDHAFSVPSGTSVDIVILSLGYQNMRILAFSTTSSTSIPVSQVIDRQYYNPA